MNRTSWCGLIGFATLVVALGSLGPSAPAAPETSAPAEAVYHKDPEHLWNRLADALYARVGPDGKTYGRDRLEPLLWTFSKHLLEERSNQQAVTALDEFLRKNGETLVDDPVKRAMLQRDLWLV